MIRQDPSSPPCDEMPELNKKVLDFVKSRVGKKTGRGECWDLAAEALNSVNANWDHDFEFGRKIDPAKECVYPGDIIQFRNIRLEYKMDGALYKEDMEKHTAVIFEVKEKDSYILAEQNTSYGGKKVTLKPFLVSNVKKGKFQIYRPQK